MEQKVCKQVKMPKWLVAQAEKAAKAESASFSQFMRTAAINELKRRKVA